jgi:hypothetical protein
MPTRRQCTLLVLDRLLGRPANWGPRVFGRGSSVLGEGIFHALGTPYFILLQQKWGGGERSLEFLVSPLIIVCPSHLLLLERCISIVKSLRHHPIMQSIDFRTCRQSSIQSAIDLLLLLLSPTTVAVAAAAVATTVALVVSLYSAQCYYLYRC